MTVKRKQCIVCLSRITPSNPAHTNGGCAWCNGQGDYSDYD
jgi:hypothetical protein